MLALSPHLPTSPPIFAQVALTSAKWQVLPSQRLRRKEARDIEHLALPPGTLQEPVAAVFVLKNAGAKTAVGVLLRYAVSVRIVPVGDPADAGTWSVAFWTEEERVPQIGAGKEKRVVIRNLHLDGVLRQLHREGFWVRTLRVQVMAEPRRGEDFANKIVEAELPVEWEGKNP